MDRRRCLRLGGVALTTVLAGCSTEGAEEPEEDDPSENGIRDTKYVDPIETETPTPGDA